MREHLLSVMNNDSSDFLFLKCFVVRKYIVIIYNDFVDRKLLQFIVIKHRHPAINVCKLWEAESMICIVNYNLTLDKQCRFPEYLRAYFPYRYDSHIP